MRILWFFAAVLAGTLTEIYTYQVVQIFGHISFAERFFGSGGTYVFWKIAGVILILLGLGILRGYVPGF